MFFSPKDARLMYSELGQFPPRDFVNKPQTFVPMHVPKVYTAPVTPPLFLTTNVAPEVRPSRKSERRRAILFAGKAAVQNNFSKCCGFGTLSLWRIRR
jgi:hypothetical protein